MTRIERIARGIGVSVMLGILCICAAFTSYLIHDSRVFTVVEEYGHLSKPYRITANYPNLGTIILHFKEPVFSTTNSFTFNIRQVGSHESVYTAKYSSKDIYYLPAYPFGFPPIANSMHNIYELFLSAKPGTNSNLTIADRGTAYELLYPFDRERVLGGEELFLFAKGKINQYVKHYINTQNYLFYIFVLIVYLLAYVFGDKLQMLSPIASQITYFKKYFSKKILLILLCILGLDVLVIQISQDIFIGIAYLLFFALILVYNLTSRDIFNLVILMLVLCPFFILSNMIASAERSSMWAYLFMTMGAIQMVAETKKWNLAGSIYRKRLYGLVADFDLWVETLVRRYTGLQSHNQNYVRQLQKYAILVIFIVLSSMFVILTMVTGEKISKKLRRSAMNPSVRLVEPTLLYRSNKVIITGNSFGSKFNNKYRLIQDSYEIRTDYWENDKIIFTVPLDWKVGTHRIWIEKPVEWEGKTVIEKTKPVMIRVLPVTGRFTPEDDLYFEQMKTWRQETREINGYN